MNIRRKMARWGAICTLVAALGTAAEAATHSVGPGQSINQALAKAEPGDTVLVRGGVYEEAVSFKRSGTEGKRIVLKAAPGEQVTVRGIFSIGVSFCTVDGLHCTGNRHKYAGIGFRKGHHNKILNCVVFDNAKANNYGIQLAHEKHSVVRNCISVRNTYGINIAYCDDCLAEGNATGANEIDAINVVWKSHRVRVVRNYVFNNWKRNHPDGFQTGREVQHLVIDSNLFYDIGQGWQSCETEDVTIINNIWFAPHAGNCISMSAYRKGVWESVGGQGSDRPNNVRLAFVHNTFFGGNVSVGGDGKFLNNIVVPGKSGHASNAPPPFQGKRRREFMLGEVDHNLFWFYPGVRLLFHSVDEQGKRVNFNDFAAYQAASDGRNAHSICAKPKFRNAPLIHAYYHFRKRGQSTREKLYVWGLDRAAWQVGDYVEMNCDGIPRRIKETGADFIVFDPPLKEAPHDKSQGTVLNWKQVSNFTPDLRLAEGSPGKGLGKDGRDAGSSIDIQAYMRGDFDGDGKRDIPELPKALKQDPGISRFLK